MKKHKHIHLERKIKKRENLIFITLAVILVFILGYVASEYYNYKFKVGRAYTFSYDDEEFVRYGRIDIIANQPEIVDLTIDSSLEKATMDISGLGENIEITIAGEKIITATGSLEEFYFTITDYTVSEEITLPDTINIYVPKGAIISEAEITIEPIEETSDNIDLLNEGIDSIDTDTEDPKALTLNLEYNADSEWDPDDDGIEPQQEGIVDLTVENSNFNVAEEKLCTKWTILSEETENSICYGNTECCNFIELAPSSDNWNDIYYSNFEKDDATNDNTISAQIIYANYSLDPDNPYSDVIYSTTESLPVKFIDTEKKLFLNEKEITPGKVDIRSEIDSSIRDCDRPSCKIELNLDSNNIGKVAVSKLHIKYILTIQDFSPIVNSFCEEYPCTVPIEISSEADGEITLSNFDIVEKAVNRTGGFIIAADPIPPQTISQIFINIKTLKDQYGNNEIVNITDPPN